MCFIVLLFQLSEEVIRNYDRVVFENSLHFLLLGHLVELRVWQVVLGEDARKFAFVTNNKICSIIQEANSSDRLGKLDLSDELSAVVPYLDQTTQISRSDDLEAAVNINRHDIIIVFKVAIHEQSISHILFQ